MKKVESRNNHRYAVVVQDITQWIQSYPCKKKKLLGKRRRACKSSWSRRGNQKVICTNNSLDVGKSCEELSWNHRTSTPHKSKTYGIVKRAVRRVKKRDICGTITIRSGRNMVGGFHGMLLLSAKRHRFIIWWEDTIRKVLQDQSFRLVHWLSITLSLRKTSHESINLERKSNLDCSLNTLCSRGIWKGDVLVADLEELETMDASEIYSKRLNAKEVIFQKEKGEFIFPIADGRIKPLEEIKIWEHPPWYGIDQFEEKVTLIILENQKGVFHHLMTHFRMPVKRLMIFGPCQEASYTAITLNPESNFTRREKNHSLFHWNTLACPELLVQIWMSSKRCASMIIGMSMGQETCRILGQVSPKLLNWKKKPPDGYMWSGRRLTRKQLTSRPDHLWPELWKSMGKHAKLKEKQKWSEEKLHLENARKLRGIYFIDPEDTEF